MALGSGSLANRCAGVVIALDAHGVPRPAVQPFDLAPLTAPLMARFGAINIEGAFVHGTQFVLINRAAATTRATCRCTIRLRRAARNDRRRALGDRTNAGAHACPGADRWHELGFTDAAPLPDGGWIFSAAAESRSGSVADGPCRAAAWWANCRHAASW